MAQQVEHVLGKDEVTGSNPVSSSMKTTIYCGFFLFWVEKTTRRKVDEGCICGTRWHTDYFTPKILARKG